MILFCLGEFQRGTMEPRRGVLQGEDREVDMRLTIVWLVLGCIVSLVGSHDSVAQSAYDYPWCAVYTKTSGAMSCYYTSFAQCMATMRGIGGTCIRSPYQDAEFRREPRSRRH
jgi:hypothetical protein